uniref:Uncharacterized protein n=1 Tax=Arundo donax TaxID=35708 RepID=A0A0A9F8R3_ARUDO
MDNTDQYCCQLMAMDQTKVTDVCYPCILALDMDCQISQLSQHNGPVNCKA